MGEEGWVGEKEVGDTDQAPMGLAGWERTLPSRVDIERSVGMETVGWGKGELNSSAGAQHKDPGGHAVTELLADRQPLWDPESSS